MRMRLPSAVASKHPVTKENPRSAGAVPRQPARQDNLQWEKVSYLSPCFLSSLDLFFFFFHT